MASNIRTGVLEQIAYDADRRRLFENKFNEDLKELEPDPEARKRRADEGPPIFTEGETITLRGAKFRVGRIDTNKLILRPLKG